MRHIAHCLLMNCGLAQDESFEMQLFSRCFECQPQIGDGMWLGYNKVRQAKILQREIGGRYFSQVVRHA